MPIKYEEPEGDLSQLSLQDPPQTNDENEDTNTAPPSKKRRLSETTTDPISNIKQEPTATAQKPIAKPKRGRPTAGGNNAFTPEQDAYLIHLRQTSSNADEIWISFEKKFHSGKNSKALCNRWFAIKDSVLLSGEEDQLLTETIEEVMGDVAASIVEKFKAKTGKKVTKGYVQRKMKEGKGAKGKEE
ncbi:hypothetical protein TWF481_000060 [Arthrobotrys musiformis]|uniref:Myb-like domain-containing protein n=1 Tax=Arthrobotrys musiformis TaxID=47236 RepID=A0AAV9WNB3_9PEZI